MAKTILRNSSIFCLAAKISQWSASAAFSVLFQSLISSYLNVRSVSQCCYKWRTAGDSGRNLALRGCLVLWNRSRGKLEVRKLRVRFLRQTISFKFVCLSEDNRCIKVLISAFSSSTVFTVFILLAFFCTMLGLQTIFLHLKTISYL